jgi:hypothetical protein
MGSAWIRFYSKTPSILSDIHCQTHCESLRLGFAPGRSLPPRAQRSLGVLRQPNPTPLCSLSSKLFEHSVRFCMTPAAMSVALRSRCLGGQNGHQQRTNPASRSSTGALPGARCPQAPQSTATVPSRRAWSLRAQK